MFNSTFLESSSVLESFDSSFDSKAFFKSLPETTPVVSDSVIKEGFFNASLTASAAFSDAEVNLSDLSDLSSDFDDSSLLPVLVRI